MAISKDDLLIAIQADTSDAKIGIERLTKAVEGLGDSLKSTSAESGKIGNAFSGIERRVIVLNQALDLAGRAYSMFIRPAIELVSVFQENQDAVNKLSGTLTLLGDKNVPQTVKQFVALSQAIEDMIGVDEKAVLSMLSMAKASGQTNAEVSKLAKTAADFSVGAGISFESAFFALQKTLKGSAIGIATFRPELKNLTEEQLKAGQAIEFISQRYAGYSRLIEGSFAMSVARAADSVDDLRKAVGGLISEFIPVQGVVETFTSVIKDMVKFIKMVPKDLGLISAAFQAVKFVLVEGGGAIIEAFDNAMNFISNALLAVLNLANTVFNLFAMAAIDAFRKIQMIGKGIGLVDEEAIKRSTELFEQFAQDGALSANMMIKNLKNLSRTGADAAKNTAKAMAAAAGVGGKPGGMVAPIDPEYASELENLKAKTLELQTAAASFGLTQREQIKMRLDGELKMLEIMRQQYLAKKQFSAAAEIERQMAAKGELAGKQIEAAPSQTFEQMTQAGQKAAAMISGQLSEGMMGVVAGGLAQAQMIVDAIQGLIDAGPRLLESIAKIFNSLAELPTKLIDGLVNIDKALQNFIDNFPEAFSRLMERLPELIANILEKLGALGPTISKALIRSAPRFIVALVKEAPRLAIAMAKGFVEAVVDMLKEFGSGMWKMSLPEIDASAIEKGVSEGIKRLTDEASKTFAVLDFDAAKTRGESAGQAIDRGLVKLNNWFIRFLEDFAQLVKSLWEIVGAILSAFSVERIKQAFVVVFSALKNILMIPVEAFRGIANWFSTKLAADISAFFSGTEAFFRNLFANVGDTIAARFRDAIAEIGRIFEPIVQVFRDIFGGLQKLADNIASLNPFGGGGGGGGGGVLGKVTKALGFAHGGLIYAQNGLMIPRGTDSVPAMLTPGEFIMSRAAVNRFGQPFMDQINRGLTPTAATGGSTVVNVSVNIENTGQLDDNFIRSRLMPAIKNEFRRASLDGQFIISGKGVR